MKINYTRPKLYPLQRKAFFGNNYCSLIFGSTKSGKSVAALVWIFEEAIKQKRSIGSFWWLAPSIKQARIMFKRLIKYLPEQLYTSNKTELTVTLVNGNTITFLTTEDVDKLYGEQCWAIVVDEFTRCREEVWALVHSVTTTTQGKIRLVGNVRGMGFWWDLYNEFSSKDSDNYKTFSITAYDAVKGGVLPKESLDRIKETFSSRIEIFNELYLNIPAIGILNPFGKEAIESCCVDTFQKSTPVVFGIDLAKSQDWTVIVGLNEQGNVCYFERFQRDWEFTFNRIYDVIKDIPALIDSTGVGDPIVERLKRNRPLVEGYTFSSTSKQQLMESLKEGLQNGRCKYPSSTPIKQELSAFEYKYSEEGRVKYRSIISDDCVMALALAWFKYSKPQNNLLDVLDKL